MKELEDCKVGDWVYSVAYGWLRILDYDEDAIYPIKLGRVACNIAGKAFNGHKNPTVFTYDPINGTEPPQPEIDWLKVPVDTKVLVRDEDGEEWVSRHFAIYLPSGDFKYGAFPVGYAHATTTGELVYWDQCQIHPHVEIKQEWLKDE